MAEAPSPTQSPRPYPTPRLHVAQPYERSLVEVERIVAAAAGYDLMDWQLDGLRDWSAVDADGKWVHQRCGDSIPRQAGKSVKAIVHATTAMVAQGASVLWTDHNYSTTCEMLERFRDIFGHHAHDRARGKRAFNDMVLRTVSKTAQESIFLKNGGAIHFSTRTKSAGLGFSFDMVVFDEAQELTEEQQQAILPTTTSGRLHNVQFVFSGTPTRAGSRATIFRDLRRQAQEGGEAASDLCWWEWGVDEVGDISDETRWRTANPSIDAGLANVVAIRTAARQNRSTPLAFAQEYLGYWLPGTAAAEPPVIGAGLWDRAASAMPAGGRRCIGVRFSADGSTVDVAEAALAPDGTAVVSVAVHAPAAAYGLGRLADHLADRLTRDCGMAAIDGRSYAGALAQTLQERRLPPDAWHVMGTAEAVTACAALSDGVAAGSVGHVANDGLDPAMAACTRRQIGKSGGWGFAGEGEGPLTACAQALWALRTTRRDPNRKARIG